MSVRKCKGFTVVELLISLSIMSMILVSVYGGFRYLGITQKSNIGKTLSLQRAEKAAAYISKDVCFCLGIDTGTYVGFNTATAFVVAMPAIKSDGTIITEDTDGDPVSLGTYQDYFYYWYDAGDEALKRQVIVDGSAPAPIGRQNSTTTIAENIDSVMFSSGGTIATSLEKLSSGQLGNMDTLFITLTSSYDGALADPIDKTLSFKVRFRNK